MSINAISPAASAYAASQQFKPSAANADFAAMLAQVVGTAAESGAKADAMTAQAAAGGKPDLVDVVTAVAESEAALEALVAVRDKVIQAYDDILRMPI